MCIAFPKTTDGQPDREPGWKSTLLLIPRLLGLLWLFTRMLASSLLTEWKHHFGPSSRRERRSFP